MRNLLIVLLLSSGTLYASEMALAQKVSITMEKAALKQVIQAIEQQTDLGFLYNEKEVNTVGGLSLNMSQTDVGEVLEYVLRGTNLTYSIDQGTILISARTNSNAVQQPRTATVTGVVADQNGMPLAGVSVVIKGSTRGVITDATGHYEIAAPAAGQTLLFSFLGKQPQEVVYTGQAQINVTLRESVERIDEVIITGYQQIDKRQSTSAVAMLKADDINQIGATSIEDMLQGQLPGLSVVNTSAAPGAAPKIRVRGTATISGNADPLWVLDGVLLETSVPVSAAELNSPDFMNMFNSVIGGISPNDIESITILKDASATAIYGTRAANGVIVVTTKKGKRNGFNISYQHTSSISMRPSYRDFDLLNSQQRVELTQQTYDDGLWVSGSVGMEQLMEDYGLGNLTQEEYARQVAILEKRNTDWFDILFRNAYSQTHNLSVSGGSDKMDYRTSVSYSNEQGMDKLSGFRNFSGMAKANMELFRGVNLSATIQAGRRDRDSYHSSIDPFTYAMRTSRTVPLYDEDGNPFFYKSTGMSGYYLFNILNEQQNTHMSSTQTDVKGIMDLSVHLFKGLKYSGLFSYSSSHSSSMNYATERSTYAAGIRGYDYGAGTPEQIESTRLPFGGVYSETNYEQRTSLIRNGLEYKGDITDELSIEALVGQEFRNTNYKGLSSMGYGYMHDRGNIFYDPAESAETGHLARNSLTRTIPERSYISYYGVLSAMFKDRYIINGNARFDGSNLFGSNPKYRYLPLWSVSAKWLVSNEPFLASAPGVSMLALRASYGLRGNIVEDSSPQIIAQALQPNEFTKLLEMGIIQPPNPDLKWETTSSINIGLDFGFFNDRLRGTIDYYLDNSYDLIAMKDISSVSGFTSKYVNYADVRNQGIDVGITGTIIDRPNVTWTASLNLGYVHNKVTKSFITPEAQNLVKSVYIPGQVYEGKPINSMFSYRFAKLNENGEPLFYDQDNNLIGSDDQNIGTLIYSNVANLKYEGTRDPVLSGGFNNTVRVKDFTLSVLFSFGLKYSVRLPDYAYRTSPSSDQNANANIMDRWRKQGDEATKTIPRLSGGSTYFPTGEGTFYSTSLFNQSSETVVPGDYLRLRNLMIEYRLPWAIANRFAPGGRTMKGLSIKLQAQNLFVVKNKALKGYDPETINYSTSGYGSMPLKPSVTLGLNINF